jgi:hypothetical protein
MPVSVIKQTKVARKHNFDFVSNHQGMSYLPQFGNLENTTKSLYLNRVRKSIPSISFN